jgi:RecJ-like exonuclease
MKTGPIPICKKCRLCKGVKLLNQFEIDDKTKDKHAAICKDCFTKQSLLSTQQQSVCSCICERCTDGKIVKTAFSAVELLLTRVEKGLNLSEDMLMMIPRLAYSAGILCDNCEKQLADKFAINDV